MRLRHSLFAVSLALGTTLALAAPASAGPATEHFRLLNTSVSADATIVAQGPLHATGKSVSVNNHRDRFVFPMGALIVRHYPTSSHDSFDKKTCYGQHTESGTYTVLGGTRDYSDASGHGSYTLVINFVGCSHHKPPRVFTFEVDASGPLSL